MEFIAQTNGVRISPRKVRLIADSIRGLSIEKALRSLSLTQKRGSSVLEKAIKSAMSNALHNKNVSQENLVLSVIDVGEGQALKRYHPSTRGRVHTYKKRSSRVRIILKEKPVGAKAMTGKGGKE